MMHRHSRRAGHSIGSFDRALAQEGRIMRKSVLRSMAIGVVLIMTGGGVATAQTNFAKDVNSALDHFLDYARGQIDANNLGNPPSIDPIGLVGLTLMEKHDLTVAGFP